MRRRSAWWFLLACLVVAGLIRAAIPNYIPEYYDVRPDDDGVAATKEITVQLLDFEISDTVLATSEFDTETEFTTEHVFVVVHVVLTPHEKTFFPTVEVRTRDGYSYEHIEISGIPVTRQAYVGATYTGAFVVEIPADKVDGASLTFRGLRPTGLLPVNPLVRFDIPEIEQADRAFVSPVVVGPAR